MNPKRILVLQTAFIGDVILTTPLLRHLKEIFPNAKIDVLCIPQTKQVIQDNPNINEIITFDKRKKTNKNYRRQKNNENKIRSKRRTKGY